MTEEDYLEFIDATFRYIGNIHDKFLRGRLTTDQFEKYCEKIAEWEDVAYERTWGEVAK